MLIIIMKTKNPKTVNDLLDKKYGKSGTNIRKDFEQKTEAYMVAELVKESRKKRI